MSLVVNFGGGVNSLAVLCGLRERGERPDVVIFADTGSEKPETYASNAVVDDWLTSVGFPAITVVANGGREIRRRDGSIVSFSSLEDECLKTSTLPSRAYGFGRCADHWKRRPIERWLKSNVEGPFTQAIGYDAGEESRVKSSAMSAATLWFPLIEWRWGRMECVSAIVREGLPVPPKSACFFCPSSKKAEIFALSDDLKTRAVAIERAAKPDLGNSLKGLGRSFSWESLLDADERQARLFPEAEVENCMMCSDGEGANP